MLFTNFVSAGPTLDRMLPLVSSSSLWAERLRSISSRTWLARSVSRSFLARRASLLVCWDWHSLSSESRRSLSLESFFWAASSSWAVLSILWDSDRKRERRSRSPLASDWSRFSMQDSPSDQETSACAAWSCLGRRCSAVRDHEGGRY